MKRSNALFNSTIGIAGLVVFTVSVIASTALLTSPRQNIPYEKLKASAIESCQKSTQQAGFVVIKDGGSVEAKLFGLEDHEKKILRSTVAIQHCQNMQMTEFCMGDCKDKKGAEVRGVVFRMSYFDPAMK